MEGNGKRGGIFCFAKKKVKDAASQLQEKKKEGLSTAL